MEAYKFGLLLVLACLTLEVLGTATEQKTGWINGYIPQSTPFDNPATLTDQTPTIPNAPDCSIRPQTVVEIQRMRESASRIAQMIEAEVQIMNKRKTYVEQMTAYLNDRIRELNKVKTELSEETRWVEVSTNRIEELSQREKLVKMQDILACLNQEQNQFSSEATVKQASMTSLQDATRVVQTRISMIKQRIDAAVQGLTGAAASLAAGGLGLGAIGAGAIPGAPGAPVGAPGQAAPGAPGSGQ